MALLSPAGFPASLRRAGAIAAALALLAGTAGPVLAQGKDPVVAKVNGTEIHQSDLAVAEEEAGKLPPMSAEAKHDYLVQFVTDMTLLTQAAEAKKLADTKDFQQKLAFARKKLLMEDLLAQVGKDAVTDAALHQAYDEAVKQMPAQEEVKARHILIRAPENDEKASAEAKKKIEAVIARLNKGEDFAKVAKEVTEDPSGKANGGELGWFTKDQMVPEFSKVAFALKPGQISGPVHTQFGWHVIKVEDKRMKKPPTFEQVKPQLEQYVTRKAQAALITNLRAQAKIERLDKTDQPAAKPAEGKPADAKPADTTPAAPAAPAKK